MPAAASAQRAAGARHLRAAALSPERWGWGPSAVKMWGPARDKKMMTPTYLTNRHLSRRTVLKGMGVTMALPFLEAMAPARNAWGATAGRKIRLVCIEM